MKELKDKAKKIIELLYNNNTIRLVSECLNSTKKEEIYFEDNGSISSRSAQEVYFDRYRIQREIQKENTVEGYEVLLENLEKFYEDKIHLYTIAVSDSVFIIFLNEKEDKLIGVLRSYNQSKTILIELNEEYKEKGLNGNGIVIDL